MNRLNVKIARPTRAVEIPKNEHGMLSYTPEQISDYRAVLYAQVLRRHPKDGQEREDALRILPAMTGGTFGKSALLNRIASGLWPLKLAPPVSMSYPWHEVVESDIPIELWLDGSTVHELIALGERHAFMPFQRKMALINQSFWKVVEVIDDTTMDVTQDRWGELGFLWRVSIDKVLASESHQAMVAHHDCTVQRITTLDHLRKEKTWRVMKDINEMRMALDPVLTEHAMAEARAKGGTFSRFHEMSVQNTMEAKRLLVEARRSAGKSDIPDDLEINSIVAMEVDKVFSRRDGSGWYSAGPGGELYLHTWRIRRISPDSLEEDIYLDASCLPRAPDTLKVC